MGAIDGEQGDAAQLRRRRNTVIAALVVAAALLCGVSVAAVLGLAVILRTELPAPVDTQATSEPSTSPVPDLVVIPDLSGVIASPEEIQAQFAAAGLAIGLIKWELSDAPYGSVIAVSPPPGTAVPRWTTINITFADAAMEDAWGGDYPDLSDDDDSADPQAPPPQQAPSQPQAPLNVAPTAAFDGTGDKTAYTPYRLILSAAASSDDKAIIRYVWGIQGQSGEYLEFSGVSFDHNFSWQPQVVTLMVWDAEGASDTTETWISWKQRQDGTTGAKAVISAR